jgi:hypothetical protein
MKHGNPVFPSLAILLIGFSFALVSPPVCAQDAQTSQDPSSDAGDVRVARLSFALGEVQYQRPNEDRQSAPANLPIEEGFHLVAANGRAEVQFDSGVIVRLAENSELEFAKMQMENNLRVTEINLIQGSIEVTADKITNESFVVNAPGMRLTVPHSSRFRVDTSQGDSWASVLKGDLLISANSGETRLSSGHTIHVSGSNADQASIELNAPLDDFDRWAAGRDVVIEQGYSQALAYVEPYDADYADYTYGISDLSSYGSWNFISGYGYCWQPYGIGIGWVPFYYGSWLYSGRHHRWTWVSNEPWGWLPYHTGHWINAGERGWAWQPRSTRTWNPAPVNWLRVGNQIAWAPAGSFNGTGVLPASGVVTGELNPRGTVIKPGGHFPVTSESFARSATAPSAPVSSPRRSESVTPVNGAITYDPAARTYMNSRPASEAVPARIPPGGQNNERPTPGSNFVSAPAYHAPADPGSRPASVPPAVHVQQAQPAPVQHYSAPVQHYSPPPSPAPAPHYSAPAAPASHSGGGSSSGHR